MDFFNAQREARKSTKTLIFLFSVAVVGLILGMYGLVSGFLYVSDGEGGDWSNGAVFAITCLGTLAVVGGGTAYKVSQLRDGGEAVCRMMGAMRIPLTAPDEELRRLRNVAEEMAIAAGVPVPQLFVLDREKGINAFAAGFTPRDAAICVTRGCLEQFDRDELQGVMAHEFSHILNGDMRLNIRLMGVLHGILCISLAGYVLLRNGHVGGGRRGGAVALIGAGLGLVVLGSVGSLFAKLIKAAVSRQREFLADASAVQFTRNPNGIRDALKKIGGFEKSGRVESVAARAASHMFFANAVSGGMADWFATHPPIQDRIRAIDKSFRAPKDERPEAARLDPGATQLETLGVAALAQSSSISAQAAIASVGNVDPEHLAYGRRVLDELPLAISVALRDPFSARAVVYGLLLDPDREIRRAQFKGLNTTSDAATVEETLNLSSAVLAVDRHLHLSLVDLAIPALRRLSLEQARTFRGNVQKLIHADAEVSLFEYAVEKVLNRNLDAHYVGPRNLTVRIHKIDEVILDCRRVLTILAHHGHDSGLAAQQAFSEGADQLHHGDLSPLPLEGCGREELDGSLDRLAVSSPEIKRTALTSFAHAVASDGVLTPTEADVLRAVADAMECPMPPIPLPLPAATLA